MKRPDTLTLLAPLAGWSASLDEAPDEVFAARLMGDGVAIDPTAGTLHAPCDGEIVLLPATRHAVTLRTVLGCEILVHVGIDTVALGGEGFEAHVQEGAQVRAGDRLLSFDLDLLARRAKSVLTPIIVTADSGCDVRRRSLDREVAVGEWLMEVVPRATGGHGHGGRGDRVPAPRGDLRAWNPRAPGGGPRRVAPQPRGGRAPRGTWAAGERAQHGGTHGARRAARREDRDPRHRT